MKEVETLCVVAFILLVAWAIETLRDCKMTPARRFWLGLALAVLCAFACALTWQVAKARDDDFGTNRATWVKNARQPSAIWRKVLTALWSEQTTKNDIAKSLHLPVDEIEGLIWNLAGPEIRPAERDLRAIK
jgi:hypothetical protein